jgi:hypothetical protein
VSFSPKKTTPFNAYLAFYRHKIHPLSEALMLITSVTKGVTEIAKTISNNNETTIHWTAVKRHFLMSRFP